MLYSRVPPGRLAFEKPGKYFIRTGDEPPDSDNWHARSNVVAVQVVEPVGFDARVWQRMQDKPISDLVQSGSGPAKAAESRGVAAQLPGLQVPACVLAGLARITTSRRTPDYDRKASQYVIRWASRIPSIFKMAGCSRRYAACRTTVCP